MDMSKKLLAELCKQHGLYRTPSLNDKLYANFQGFTQITELDEYTGLKALFLEGNALSTLDGLPHLPELKCLFVQNNRIQALGNLDQLPLLNTLNISNNEVHLLTGLEMCSLETLLCAHNKLDSKDSVAHLVKVTSLQTVDLQHNLLGDPEILELLKLMPQLKCLYLTGNPVVAKIANYRKTLIAALPQLTYLDDRPVFPIERATAVAWAQGGVEAERAARESMREQDRARDRRNFEYMQAIRAEGFRQKRRTQGLPEGDTDPMLDDMSDDEWVAPGDPPELLEARAKLDQYLAQQQPEGDDSDMIPAGSAHTDGVHYAQAMAAAQLELGGASAGASGLTHDKLQPSLKQAAEQLSRSRLQDSAQLTTSSQVI